MAVTAVRAGDVVVVVQRFADADGNRLFTDVEVREARHQRAGVEIVDPLLEQANRHHLPIHREQFVLADLEAGERRVQLVGCRHAGTPDIWASTWKIAAKSLLGEPHAARGGEQLVGDGRGRQRHVEPPPHLERQRHVLLHHVHVEPRFVRHVAGPSARGTAPSATR